MGASSLPICALIEDSIQDVFLAYWKRKDSTLPRSHRTVIFSLPFRYSLFKKITRERRHHSPWWPLRRRNRIFLRSARFISRPGNYRGLIVQQTGAGCSSASLTWPPAGGPLSSAFMKDYLMRKIAVVMNISVKASYKLMAGSLLRAKEWHFHLPVWLFSCTFFMPNRKKLLKTTPARRRVNFSRPRHYISNKQWKRLIIKTMKTSAAGI